VVKNERFCQSRDFAKSQRKPRPGRSARLLGFPNGRTDGRTIGRSDYFVVVGSVLVIDATNPRPTDRKKNLKRLRHSKCGPTIENDPGGGWVVIPSLLVTNDPRSLSLAPRARTMFSVEPIDQSARTTTLRFACVVVKEEKHRQSFIHHSSNLGMVVVCSSSYLPRIHRSGNPSSHVPYERHATC
jgi:hypothetical protein